VTARAAVEQVAAAFMASRRETRAMGTVHAIRDSETARGRMKALGVSGTNYSDNYGRMTMDTVAALVEMAERACLDP
jgi:hypothetical protein